MQDLTGKITGSTLTAAEWNQLPQEVQNVITALGITLGSGDLNQLGKAVAGYVANGTFYTDSGVANAYVLSVVGAKQAATAYTDGFEINFVTVNPNTGASTVNVAGLGVKNIKLAGGADPSSGDITGRVSAVFDSGNDWFELTNPKVTGVTAFPVSSIISVPVNSVPAGFLECDGSAISRTTYSDLFAVIGTTYGIGDGSTTFNIPDLRGEFIRGWDNGRGVDSGRGIATSQAGENDSSTFSSARLINSTPRSSNVTVPENGESNGLYVDALSAGGSYVVRFTNSSDGDENRPRNISMMYCIKF